MISALARGSCGIVIIKYILILQKKSISFIFSKLFKGTNYFTVTGMGRLL